MSYMTSFICKVQELLGISDYAIYAEEVSIDQVSAEDGNRQFVGICVDHKQRVGFLYYSRILTEEDVVHELVHVAYPKYTEEEVNIAATDILNSKLWQIAR